MLVYSRAHISMLGFKVSCTQYCYRLAKFRNKNSVSNFNVNKELTVDNCQNTLSRDWRSKDVSLRMVSIILPNLTVLADC